MDGRELSREDGKNRLSEYGKETLRMISNPLFISLIERGSGKEPDVELEDLKLNLIWSKDG